MPLGGATVSDDLVFTTLYTGVLVALNPQHRRYRLRAQAANLGQRAYRHRLGNAIRVPAGGPSLYGAKGGSPQLVVYTVP